MPIRFQCPSCNVIRSFNDRLLGRRVRCPNCGTTVQLPTAEQIEEGKRAKQVAREEESRLEAVRTRPAVTAVSDQEANFQKQIDADERALAAASANFLRPKPPSRDDMDMTPMVDVTFLLLIFFMITASFSIQKSIQRPAQKNDDPSTQQVEPPDDSGDIVTVQVDEFNAFNVVTSDWDRIVASKQDLIIALSDAFGGNSFGKPPSRLIVLAHEDCIHSAVIAALDAGREAHFENFEISTVEQFD